MHSRFTSPRTRCAREGAVRPQSSAKSLHFLIAALICGFFSPFGTQPLRAQTTQAMAVVSAANFQPVLSPNSLGSVFGAGLASELVVASYDGSGKLPTELGGIKVSINGKPAELIFVSPEQINFIISPDVEIGVAEIIISRTTGPAASSSMEVVVQTVAPGIFSISCLRPDRGAVLNGVTFALEPFLASTTENHIDDKRTRLSLFGTGIRYAGGSAPASPNVAQYVAVEATDAANRTFELAVEYAGPAPDFAGVDQVNVVLEPELDGIGVLRLRLRIGNSSSNIVTVQVSPGSLRQDSTASDYLISTIAGTGAPGLAGDGGPALEALLQTPSGAALDAAGNLYIADVGNHVVRRVGQDGIITTFAGTGESGSSGDGGPAVQARIKRPVAVAADRLGSIFIVDAEDHRIRKVDSNGVITAFAGTGVAGFSGDGGAAIAAQLNNPSSVAVNAFGSVYIADSGNHRVRLVTSDGLIQTVAGTGQAGLSGDGGLAALAQLNSPTSVATSPNHTVFVADAGNHVIRRLELGGGISALAGCGEEGDSGDNGDAAEAKFGSVLHLALDAEWRMFISDAGHHRVRLIDSNCVIHALAGNGQAGFSGDGGPAVEAMVNEPLGVAANPFGDIYLADSSNHRIRLLWRDFGDGSGEPGEPSGECGIVSSLVIIPAAVIGGQTATGHVRLNCPTDHDVVVVLESSDPAVSVPSSVTIPAGQISVSFPILTTTVELDTTVMISGNDGEGNEISAPISLLVGASLTIQSLNINTDSVIGGSTATGVVTIGAPAPQGGLVIELSSNKTQATVAGSVTIPEGQTTAEFLIVTSVVQTPVLAVISGIGGGLTASDTLLILPSGGGPGTILSFSISPSAVTGGDGATGTLTLASAAPAGGVEILLHSSLSAAIVPVSVTVPAGELTVTFPIQTIVVDSTVTATLTAAAGNVLAATLQVNPEDGNIPEPSSVPLASLSLSPNTVNGGQSSTGTITLAAPAPEGGALVNLSSSSGLANVPESIVIPEGATSGQFTVSTLPVNNQTIATITAASANSVEAELTINPGGGEAPGEGQILSLTVSPSSVTGGDSSTGTVTLAAAAPAGGILVMLSSSGSATLPDSIVIPAGSSSGQFTIQTSSVVSPIAATITATSANSVSATLNIEPEGDDGPGEGQIASLTLNPATVTGGNPSTGTVTLAVNAPAGGIQVNLSSNNGSAGVPESIVIPAGSKTGQFTVSTSTVESQVVAAITASSANSVSANLTINPGGAGGPGQGQISSLTLNPSTVTGGSPSTGTVTLAVNAPAGGIQVNLSSNNGSAGVPESIVIPAGSKTGQFTVSTSTVESQVVTAITASSANSVSANLTINPGGAGGPGQGQISSLTLNPSTVTGGSPSTGTVTLAVNAPAGGIQVNLSSNKGSASVPESIVIPAGSKTGQFTVSTTTVGAQTTATITASSANSVSAVLTINPSGPGSGQIASLSLNPSTVQGGDPSTATVTLASPAPAGGVLVTLSSNRPSASVPESIVIPQGSNSGQFTVNTSAVASQTIATITASSANNVSAPLTINPAPPPCVSSVELSADVALGGTTVTGTVFLTSPAPFGGITVSLLSNSPLATVGASVTIPEGQISASFTISTKPVSALAVVQIQALIPTCTTVTATLTINAPVLQGLGISPSSIGLLGTATATVTLSGPAPAGGIVVNLAGSSHSITQGLINGVLTIGTPSSVTVPAGSTTTTFSVNATLTVLASLLQDVSGTVTADLNGVLKTANITIRGVL